MTKKLLLITATKYPDSTAMYVRVHTLAKLFQYIDYEVTVLTRGSFTGRRVCQNDGIGYISVSRENPGRLRRVFDYCFGIRHYLKKYIRKKQFDAILVSGTNMTLFHYLKKLAAVRRIFMFSDQVEWHSREQFAKLMQYHNFIANNYWTTRGLTRDWACISISSYLHNYFSGKGIASARIPVIMDMGNITADKKLNGSHLVISYAGTPGKKDYLKEIVEGCALLNESERGKIEIWLIGITEEKLISMCGVEPAIIEKVKANLRCLGRIPRSEVLEKLQQTDFTILIRPPQARYAQAGFPTKVVESLAGGTPVICNLTSDLGMYIKDMQNGIVVEDCTAEAVCAALTKAVGTTYEQRLQMCRNARITAEENFDYRKYAEPLNCMIENYKKKLSAASSANRIGK